MKQKLKIQFVLALCILSYPVSSLYSQSFLSHQRTVRKAPLIHLDESNKANEISPESVVAELVTQTKVRILSDTTPILALPDRKIQEETSEQQPDKKQIIETGPIADSTKFELDLDSLTWVSNLVNQGEYGQAQAILSELNPETIQNLPEDEKFQRLEWHRFLSLKIYFHLGDYQNVIDMSPAYFDSFSNGDNYYQAFYYFAASLHYEKKPLQLVSMVTEDFFSNLSNRESLNLREFLIEDAQKRGQLLVAFNFMLDAEGDLIIGFDRLATELIEKIEDIEDIDAILNEHSVDLIKSTAYLRKVQLLVREGEYQQAQDFLSELFNVDNIDAATLAELQGFQNYIDIALNTDPYKIGVILPFSHSRFGILARQALDGLELALQSRSPSDNPIQLIIKDSAFIPVAERNRKNIRLTAKERSALVKSQVRELVEKEKVIAILGPLAKDTSLAAGEMAEEYKVPVISFSLTEKIGSEIPFLFRYQRNRIVEAENLAHFALDYLQAERFALFYTTDRSGKGFEVMQAFNKIVIENGGQIAGISAIKTNQVDFKDNYLSLTGGFRKKPDVEGKDNSAEAEEPIIDFDLMFAQVKLNTLKILLNFNRSFDAEDVWVLSGSEINVRENQLLDHTRRLRFIDAFPIGSISTSLQPFYEDHWKSYNFRPDYHTPTSYTIYAYEALEMISRLLNDPSFHNRESLRNALQNLTGFPVLTGSVSSRQNGELIKTLNIMRIRAKKTVALF